MRDYGDYYIKHVPVRGQNRTNPEPDREKYRNEISSQIIEANNINLKSLLKDIEKINPATMEQHVENLKHKYVTHAL